MRFFVLKIYSHLQSWGTTELDNSNDSNPKTTEFFPTKSGLSGLVRCALGRGRDVFDDFDKKLLSMEYFVRVDQIGSVMKDFQVMQASHHNFKANNSSKIIPKIYLENYSFTVLMSFPDLDSNELDFVAEKLNNPTWNIFYGRKTCIPLLPPFVGVIDSDDPIELLKKIPLHKSFNDKVKFKIQCDKKVDNSIPKTLKDNNTYSFNPSAKGYSMREVYNSNIIVDDNITVNDDFLDNIVATKKFLESFGNSNIVDVSIGEDTFENKSLIVEESGSNVSE